MGITIVEGSDFTVMVRRLENVDLVKVEIYDVDNSLVAENDNIIKNDDYLICIFKWKEYSLTPGSYIVKKYLDINGEEVVKVDTLNVEPLDL